jgi:pimeloyl-ACP methyl ester carboxylesterase
MGTYDVPAEIDYILRSTGHNKLYYIGHSMGTTMFFVMMSQRPEYNQKIHAMIAFAPVGTFTRTKDPVIHFLETVIEHFLEVSAAAARDLQVMKTDNKLHIAKAFHKFRIRRSSARCKLLMSVAACDLPVPPVC